MLANSPIAPPPPGSVQDGLGSNGQDVPLPSPFVRGKQERCQATEHPSSQATCRSPASLFTRPVLGVFTPYFS